MTRKTPKTPTPVTVLVQSVRGIKLMVCRDEVGAYATAHEYIKTRGWTAEVYNNGALLECSQHNEYVATVRIIESPFGQEVGI